MKTYLVSRPDYRLSSADLVRMHAKGLPVPMVEYTVVIENPSGGANQHREFPEPYHPRA